MLLSRKSVTEKSTATGQRSVSDREDGHRHQTRCYGNLQLAAVWHPYQQCLPDAQC